MPFDSDDPGAFAFAQEWFRRTGLPWNRAIASALYERIATPSVRERVDYYEALAIARSCSSLPDLDGRSAGEILSARAGEPRG